MIKHSDILPIGGSIEVKGSGILPYVVRYHVDGNVSCSCPAWRNAGGAVNRRSCKHTIKVFGRELELERTGEGDIERFTRAVSAGMPPSSEPVAIARTNAPPVHHGDPIGGGVLLAQKWDPSIDPTGHWMSEKLDGVRAYWNGEGLYSRNGNLFAAPSWFTARFPQEISLDGELYVGPGRFNEAVSIVKSGGSAMTDPRWRQVKYMVFDMPEMQAPFEKRVVAIADLVSRVGPPMVAVGQTQCKSPGHLGQFHAAVTKQGVEGTMLRASGSRYERKRSNTLLKVKDFQDAEAQIIGYVPGAGKHRGRLGAYHCQLPDGTQFDVGTGLSDRERERPLPVGTIIVFRYQELTTAGVPRFPSYVGERAD